MVFAQHFANDAGLLCVFVEFVVRLRIHRKSIKCNTGTHGNGSRWEFFNAVISQEFSAI
jgi:hypothetical protein